MNKFFYQREKSILSGLLVLIVLTNLFIPLLKKPANKPVALAQGMGFFPRYPLRLRYTIGEINQASQQLVYLNGKLKDLTEKTCDCGNAQSQCERKGMTNIQAVSPYKVFGEPCQSRREIEKTQLEIRNKTDQISYLRELLKKEMETGLEAELKTLREDEAKELEDNLNEILDILDIDSEQNILSPALANVEILNDAQYSVEKQCQAKCKKGIAFQIIACILGLFGEEKPIEAKFELGATLEKIDLGEITIGEIGLTLPEKIELADIANIKDFEIPLGDIKISFPPTPANELDTLSLEPIIFHPSSPSLPIFPWANFSCPQLSGQVYQPQPTEEGAPNDYTDLDQYFKIFAWLSKECQKIPGLQGSHGIPDKRCLDINNVLSTIINRCDALWREYSECCETAEDPSDCGQPPGICLTNYKSIQFEKPKCLTCQGACTTCPCQTCRDNPDTGMRLDCPLAVSAIPRIKLPDIKIPDIRLPEFKLLPFLIVHLPNFIFEDLILPDLDFCNFDNCLSLIPPLISSLEIEPQYPFLMIDSIEIPSVYASLPGIPGLSGLEGKQLEIEMDKIEFPPIPLPLPEFDLTRLIALNLQVPEIPIPKPKITLKFLGLDIDFLNLFLGLLASAIHIPGGCIAAGISFIPPLLEIRFPDYYFYWPRFPEIPDLCDNEYITLDSFCQDIKEALDRDVLDKLSEIQNILNITIQNNLQNRFDEISGIYHELVEDHISQRLEEIRIEIEEKLQESFQGAIIENGMLIIPPIEVSLGEITISMEEVNKYLLYGIPMEIEIPWPEELKEIKLTEPITYQLPSIPLPDLGFALEVLLKIPGFQYPSLHFSLDTLGNYLGYEGQSPSGGNPYPVDKINANLEKISGTNKKISESAEKIEQILY